MATEYFIKARADGLKAVAPDDEKYTQSEPGWVSAVPMRIYSATRMRGTVPCLAAPRLGGRGLGRACLTASLYGKQKHLFADPGTMVFSGYGAGMPKCKKTRHGIAVAF